MLAEPGGGNASLPRVLRRLRPKAKLLRLRLRLNVMTV